MLRLHSAHIMYVMYCRTSFKTQVFNIKWAYSELSKVILNAGQETTSDSLLRPIQEARKIIVNRSPHLFELAIRVLGCARGVPLLVVHVKVRHLALRNPPTPWPKATWYYHKLKVSLFLKQNIIFFIYFQMISKKIDKHSILR